MSFRLTFYCFIFICNFYCTKSSSQPEVSIEQGTVRGSYKKTITNRQIVSFEGIPYAKPPTGKHRFKEPVAAGPWLGTYNATKEPPVCVQLDMLLAKNLVGSEDCLYINVYTPKLPDSNTSEPELFDVLAFIHGGGFVMGKSGYHGPSILLQKDVILVTFNYRVGPIGFLSTEDSVVPGNNGLKDQVLALKWIQKNIAAFGGNPNSVTLGGHSAGGASCHYHLLSPLSKGLFHRAMCVSGVAINPWGLSENAKEKAMGIANDLGCPVKDSLLMVNCLRNRPAEHIVSHFHRFTQWEASGSLAVFAPVIEPPSETAFISGSPINIIKERRGSDVPVIFSVTLDEGLVVTTEMLNNPKSYAEIQNRWDELIPYVMFCNNSATPEKKLNIGQEIKKYYNFEDTPEGRKILVKMFGDRFMVSGISKTARLSASKFTSAVYLYRFSYRGKHSLSELFYGKEEDLGVCHTDDMFYTLGFNDLFSLEDGSDLEMSNQMVDLFVSFMRNGTLGENWEPMNQNLPKIVFTDIKGPNDFQLTTVDELGEESFWDFLCFNENLNLSNRDEL